MLSSVCTNQVREEFAGVGLVLVISQEEEKASQNCQISRSGCTKSDSMWSLLDRLRFNWI